MQQLGNIAKTHMPSKDKHESPRYLIEVGPCEPHERGREASGEVW